MTMMIHDFHNDVIMISSFFVGRLQIPSLQSFLADLRSRSPSMSRRRSRAPHRTLEEPPMSGMFQLEDVGNTFFASHFASDLVI